MIRCLTRYVLSEFLKVFALVLSGLTVVIVLVLVAQETIRLGLGPAAILRLLPYTLPMALVFSIPGTTLLACCVIYGRFSSANEVTAIKAAGVSPWCLMWPTFVLAFALSLTTVWLNDLAVSWGRDGMKRVGLESVEQIVYGTLRSNHSFRSNSISINVTQVDGKRLLHPTLRFWGDGEQESLFVRAREAELHSIFERDALLVALTDGEIQRGDAAFLEFSGTEVIEIPLAAAAHKAGGQRRASDAPIREMAQIEREQQRKQQALQQELASSAAFQLLTGDFGPLATSAWNVPLGQLQEIQVSLSRLRVEPWRRYANGFSCLAFVLVGVPLSIWMQNSDFVTSFFLSFALVLLVYYPLLMFSVDQGKSGALPPYTVWMGNAVFVLIGFLFIRHELRH